MTDIFGKDYELLSIEDRLVTFEGFANQIMTELCIKNKNAYSWC